MTGWVRSSTCAAGDCLWACVVDGTIRLAQGNETGPHTFLGALDRAEWDAFTAGVKAGDFDSLGDTP